MADNEKIKSNKNEMANTLNDFISNIVKNLKILEWQCENNLHSKLSSHPALQAINYSITNKEICVSLLRKQTKEYLQD